MSRQPYHSNLTDDEWSFVAPYLTLIREDAAQRVYPLREMLNAAGGGEVPRGQAGFVLLPLRRVVERSFAWAVALPPTGAGLWASGANLDGLPPHRVRLADGGEAVAMPKGSC